MKINLGDISVKVVKRDIKNIHLSVYPPTGAVRISAPLRMKSDTIRVFAISKLGWIKKQQEKLKKQDREAPRDYLDRESHYLWGERYLLKIVEEDAPPWVELKHKKILLYIRPGANQEKKEAILDEWYREKLKEAIPPLIAKWEKLIKVKVNRFYVRRMKTKWGSCNPSAKSIRINTELVKKLPDCLEYIVVHEMAHLRERTHNKRFIALMDSLLPKWEFYREMLNQSPLRHESWR
jgi:predicted metal-dependent hydrolase